MRGKRRLSATIDADLLAAAEAAAKRGDVPNISAWVNEAMRLKLEHDRRLVGLAAFVAAVEAESGEITAEEMEWARREMRRRAIRVRGSRAAEPRRRYGR